MNGPAGKDVAYQTALVLRKHAFMVGREVRKEWM
jgi:hypothetical protein